MNCPNCGAENEAGARFCVECGAPLETQANLPDRPPEAEAMDNDRTMVSGFGRLAEEAKTVSVTQEEMAAAEAEAASAFARGPEPEVIPPFSEPVAGSGGGSGAGGIPGGGGSGPGRGWMNQRNIIIAVIILLVLCCCCSIIGGSIAASSGTFDPYLSAILPDYLPLI